jgi:hypothetical protein
MKSVLHPYKQRHWLVLAAIALMFTVAGSFAQGPSASPAPSSFITGNPTAIGPSFAHAQPSANSLAPSAKGAADIRDIRGPIHIPPPLLWAWWLAGGSALAALVYGGWRWKQRRNRADALLPYQIALAQLEAARAIMRPDSAREFSTRVSEIVREFIEERFWVRAARRTTEEFLGDLLNPSDALLVGHRASLAAFLAYCDLAKFARWNLSPGEMASMLQSARDFVFHAGAAPAVGATSQRAPHAIDQNLAAPEIVPAKI